MHDQLKHIKMEAIRKDMDVKDLKKSILLRRTEWIIAIYVTDWYEVILFLFM